MLCAVVFLAERGVYSCFDACTADAVKSGPRSRRPGRPCVAVMGIRATSLRGGTGADLAGAGLDLLPRPDTCGEQKGLQADGKNAERPDHMFKLGRPPEGNGGAVDDSSSVVDVIGCAQGRAPMSTEGAGRTIVIPEAFPTLQMGLWREAEEKTTHEALDGSTRRAAAEGKLTTFKVVASVNPEQPMVPAPPNFCLRITTQCHIVCLPGVSIDEGPVKMLGRSRGSLSCAKLCQMLNYTLVIESAPWVLESCEIRNVGGAVVRVEGNGQARFLECAVGGVGPEDDRTRDGFWLLDRSSVTLDSCRIEHTSMIGIVCWQDTVCRVNGCWIQNTKAAVDLNDRAVAHVCGCRIENVVHGAFWAKIPGHCEQMTQLVALDNHIQGEMWWGDGRPAKLQDDGNVISPVQYAVDDKDEVEDIRDVHIRSVQVCSQHMPEVPKTKEPIIPQAYQGLEEEGASIDHTAGGSAMMADMWNVPLAPTTEALDVVMDERIPWEQQDRAPSQDSASWKTASNADVAETRTKPRQWYNEEGQTQESHRRGKRKRGKKGGDADIEGPKILPGSTLVAHEDGSVRQAVPAGVLGVDDDKQGLVGGNVRRRGRPRNAAKANAERTADVRRAGSCGEGYRRESVLPSLGGLEAPEELRRGKGLAGVERPRCGRVKSENLLFERMASAVSCPSGSGDEEKEIDISGVGILNSRKRAWMNDYGDLPPQSGVGRIHVRGRERFSVCLGAEGVRCHLRAPNLAHKQRSWHVRNRCCCH